MTEREFLSGLLFGAIFLVACLWCIRGIRTHKKLVYLAVFCGICALAFVAFAFLTRYLFSGPAA